MLQDVYDVPALTALLQRVQRREVQLVDVATQSPSPFARSLLFGYVAAFMYEGDSPIAERRAAALTLDQGLLAELLGRAELRELLDLVSRPLTHRITANAVPSTVILCVSRSSLAGSSSASRSVSVVAVWPW